MICFIYHNKTIERIIYWYIIIILWKNLNYHYIQNDFITWYIDYHSLSRSQWLLYLDLC